jgi:hypothetical protein
VLQRASTAAAGEAERVNAEQKAVNEQQVLFVQHVHRHLSGGRGSEPKAAPAAPSIAPAPAVLPVFNFESEIHQQWVDYLKEPVAGLDLDKLAESLERGMAKWLEWAPKYPLLAAVARRVLCIPATAADVESLWSVAGHLMCKRRAALSSTTAEAMLFLYWNRRLWE